MPVALQLQAAWETACKASLPRSAHKHLNDVWSISVDCGLAKVLGGASVGSTSEAVLDSATGRRNDVLRRAKLPLPWDAATAREVVGFLLTELRLTDPAVVDAVLRQCREPKVCLSTAKPAVWSTRASVAAPKISTSGARFMC
jgi:hypothetical protein